MSHSLQREILIFLSSAFISSCTLVCIDALIITFDFQLSSFGLLVYFIPATYAFFLYNKVLRSQFISNEQLTIFFNRNDWWLFFNMLIPWLVVCIFLFFAHYGYLRPNILGYVALHFGFHSVNYFSWHSITKT